MSSGLQGQHGFCMQNPFIASLAFLCFVHSLTHMQILHGWLVMRFNGISVKNSSPNAKLFSGLVDTLYVLRSVKRGVQVLVRSSSALTSRCQEVLAARPSL